MRSCRPPLFRNRQFEPEIIVTCVRWYLRFCLSLRDVEELMAERGLSVDHTTIWRWAQRYGPEVYRRLSGKLKPKSLTWHVDETFVRVAGRWMYLFRAVDRSGQTIDFYLSETRDREAAKNFLRNALSNPDNRAPHILTRDGLRSYPAAVRQLQEEGQLQHRCRQRSSRYCNNRIESDHRHIKRRLRAMQGPRTAATAWAAIQGIEAAQIIRKGRSSGSLVTIYSDKPGSSGHSSIFLRCAVSRAAHVMRSMAPCNTATPARLSQEIVAARQMLDRAKERFGLQQASVTADKSYGTGEFLSWLSNRKMEFFNSIGRLRNSLLLTEANQYRPEQKRREAAH